MRRSKIDFIRQQGFTTGGCQDGLYSALMFQPRVIGGMAVLGVIVQSPWVLLAVSTVLWWSVLVPTHNPFDAFFNRAMAGRLRLATLPAAPEPRRFAAALAGTFAMAIGVALFVGASRAAWVLEGLFAGAVLAVIFGRLCLGAALYHLLWSGTPARECPPSMGPESLRHEQTAERIPHGGVQRFRMSAATSPAPAAPGSGSGGYLEADVH